MKSFVPFVLLVPWSRGPVVLFLFAFFAFFAAIPTHADSTRISALVTITNAPTTAGQTLTVNSSTRTWTNNPALNPAIYIRTNATIGGSMTNLFLHLAQYPFATTLTETKSGTNAIKLQAALDQALTVTASGGWASVTYTTQLVTTPFTVPVRVPFDVETATNAAQIAELLLKGLNDYSTSRAFTNWAITSPAWSGLFTFAAGQAVSTRTVNTNYNVTTNDFYIGVNSVTNTVPITLPAATNTSGQIWVIHDDAGAGAANNITLNPASGDRINGATNYVLASNYEGALLISRGGTNFYVYATGLRAPALVNDSVTFAKMQNIATDRLIGRDTASTGDPEEITVGGGLEFTGSGGIQRSALTGDVTASAGSGVTTIAANAVALGTDTTGNYVADVVGTSGEVTVSHTPGEGSTATISLPASIDLGGKTLEIPNSAAPSTTVTGQLALDTSITDHRPLLQYHADGTNYYAIAIPTADLASTDGYVIKYNAANDKFTMAADEVGAPASGDSLTINGTAATDAEFTNTSTFIWSIDTTPSPDVISGYPTNLANAQISASAAIAKSKISSSGTWTAAEIPALQTTADGGGNTIKMKGYIVLASPFSADGAGAVISSNNNSLVYFGQALMSGSAATNANYIEYRITVPEDIDTSIDLKVERWKFRLSNTDTGAHTYNIGMASVADSATYDSPTLGQWVALSFAGDASGASGDVETVSNVTLTSWKSNVTAGQLWVIRINRDGANDASTVAAYSGPLVLSYGISQ